MTPEQFKSNIFDFTHRTWAIVQCGVFFGGADKKLDRKGTGRRMHSKRVSVTPRAVLCSPRREEKIQ